MLKKASKAEQARGIGEWETFEGVTYGYDFEFNRVVEISAQVRDTSWTVASNVRGWYVTDPNNSRIASGEADGLREAKRAALAALDGAP
jgi:hypothetical protein